MIDRRFLWAAVAARGARNGRLRAEDVRAERRCDVAISRARRRGRRVEHRAYLRFNELLLSDSRRCDRRRKERESGENAAARHAGGPSGLASETWPGVNSNGCRPGRTSLARSGRASTTPVRRRSRRIPPSRRCFAGSVVIEVAHRVHADCLRYAPDSRRGRRAAPDTTDGWGGRFCSVGGAAGVDGRVVDRVVDTAKHHEGGEDLFAKGGVGANAGGDAELARYAPLLVMETRRTIATTRRLRPLRRGVSEGDPRTLTCT